MLGGRAQALDLAIGSPVEDERRGRIVLDPAVIRGDERGFAGSQGRADLGNEAIEVSLGHSHRGRAGNPGGDRLLFRNLGRVSQVARVGFCDPHPRARQHGS